jgi:hypothetical protein
MNRGFVTIVTPNYLTYALALRTSLSASANHEHLLVLVVSDELPEDLPYAHGISYISLSDLSPTIPWLCKFYYMPFELCSALKPYILYHALKNHFDSCIYLDSDIYVTYAFKSIWERCSGYPFAFTPHHLAPPPDLPYTSDILIAHFGILNSGFYVCTKSVECFFYLKWLQDQLVHCGFCNSVNGMFGDQKLIPQLIQYIPESVLILKDPCLNIAFWNAHERNVRSSNSLFAIDEYPVIFFHLSGFDYRDQRRICSYLPFDVNTAIARMAPWLVDVTNDYQELVYEFQDYSSLYRCPYTHYNSIKLTRDMRWLLYQKKHLDALDPDVLRLQFITALKSIKRSVRKALGER